MKQMTLFDTSLPPEPAPRKPASYDCQLIARIPMVSEATGPQMRSARDLADYCSDVRNLSRESFHVITLDQKNRAIDRHLVSIGTLTGAPVHPREAYRAALLDSAAAVAFVHNHPSGCPEPSRDDREITARLVEAGRLLGVRVLDHVILGSQGHFSFVEEGLM